MDTSAYLGVFGIYTIANWTLLQVYGFSRPYYKIRTGLGHQAAAQRMDCWVDKDHNNKIKSCFSFLLSYTISLSLFAYSHENKIMFYCVPGVLFLLELVVLLLALPSSVHEFCTNVIIWIYLQKEQ